MQKFNIKVSEEKAKVMVISREPVIFKIVINNKIKNRSQFNYIRVKLSSTVLTIRRHQWIVESEKRRE